MVWEVVRCVGQPDPVQDCPPAHQVLRTAQTVQAGGLQLAECEGESLEEESCNEDVCCRK